MKCIELVFWLLVPELLVQVAKSSSAESDLEDSQAEGSSKQQGSWSQWWSYDGISGPDYWNINKQWRLCSLGRKQSPIEVRTERLVYDHLLGPLRLSWLPSSSTNYDDAILRKATKAQRSHKPNLEKQEPIRLRLVNSGRGLEAWLEPGLGSTWRQASSSSNLAYQQQEQLILSRGPLSYAYKLFKIELHSAPTTTTTSASLTGASAATSGAELAAPEVGGGGGGGGFAASMELQRQQLFVVGSGSSRSSEHLIDGRSFDAELQLHFYNKHLASSAIEAQQLANEDSRPNLFAAISVFLILDTNRRNGQHRMPTTNQASQISGSQTILQEETSKTGSAIDFILDNLASVQNEGDSIELKLNRGQIESLITSKRQYVTYQGSMNRPPCAESVDWILLNKPLRCQRDKFEYLFEKLNTNQENIRPIKALHRRMLRTTINNLHTQRKAEEEEEEEEEEDEDQEDQEDDEDLEFRNGDINNVELRGATKRGKGTICSNLSSSGTSNKEKKQNCSNAQDLEGGINSKSRLDGIRRKGASGWCSMKPNYAYQLRYSKIGL